MLNLFSNFWNPCQNTKIDGNIALKPYLTRIEKNLEGKQNVLRHWFFTKDSTIRNTSFITNEVMMVSKSQCIAQICWPESSNVKWQTLVFTFGTHCIHKLSCLHLNKDLRAQKLFANFFGALITINIENI
jgi:hypothetical protein